MGWLLIGQAAVVGTVLAITFVGTVAPLYSELVDGTAIAVEGRYFAAFAGPLAAGGLALVASVPLALRIRETLGPTATDHRRAGIGASDVGSNLTAAGGEAPTASLPADPAARQAPAAETVMVAAAAARRPASSQLPAGVPAVVGAAALASATPPPTLRPPLAGNVLGTGGTATEAAWVAQPPTATETLPPGRGIRAGSRRALLASAVEVLVPPGAGAIVAVGALAGAGGHIRLPQLALAVIAGAAAASAAVGAFQARRRRGRVGPHIAHAGLGLLLLGVAGTATGRTESVSLQPGETAVVLGQPVEYLGVDVDDGRRAGTSAVVADVRIGDAPRRPALVAYPDLQRVLAETSLVSSPWRDVQVGLANAGDDGTAVLRIGVHPLQVWVWWGGLVIVAGGIVTSREHRRQSCSDHPSPRK